MVSKNNEAPMAATIEASILSASTKELTMKSLAKSTVNCTNSIIISDIKIHVDAEGRYSLNDLHAAAGKFEKDKPANWLRAEKTVELIDEILNAQIRAIKDSGNSNSAELQIKKPVDSKKGRYGGTYVCKELVYSYGMWISAEFALKVIRAYDALVSGNVNEAVRIAKTTVNERTPLRDAVNLLVGKKGLRYDDAYNMVHQRFNIDSIDELDLEQIPLAVEYVHRIALEGEFLGKQEALPVPKLEIDYPLSWWKQYDWAIKQRGGNDFSHTEVCRFPEHILFGFDDDAPSAISKLITQLSLAGYDVSAVKIEYLARRHFAEVMHRKIVEISNFTKNIESLTVGLRISPPAQTLR